MRPAQPTDGLPLPPDAERRPVRPVTRGWRIALRLAVSAGALFLAVQASATLTQYGDLPPPDAGWLLATVGLHLGIIALLSARLGLTLRLLEPALRLPGWHLVRLNWASLAVGQIALGTLSGDAVRVLALTSAGARLGSAVSLILVDRLVGLVALVLLGVAALGFVLPPAAAAALVAATAAASLAGLATLWLARRHRLPGRIGAAVSDIAALAWRLVRQPGGWACLGLALLAHGLSVAIFYATARAFGLLPPLPETIVAVPAGLLSSVLPVSLGGWGVRELAIAATYRAMGTIFAAAVPASVLFGLCNVALNLPGLISLWHGFGAVGHNGNGTKDSRT